jgi:predicted nucleotidyltransferase
MLILLHGSRVDGKTHPKSDIDIAVLPKIGQKIDILDLISDFSEIYNSDKLDITDLSKADPLLLYAVTTKSKLLSGSKGIFKDLKLKAFKKYIDYLPFLKMERIGVVKNLEKFL